MWSSSSAHHNSGGVATQTPPCDGKPRPAQTMLRSSVPQSKQTPRLGYKPTQVHKKSRKQFSPERLSPTTGAEGGSEPPLDPQHQEGSSTSRSAEWKNEYRAERPKTNAVGPSAWAAHFSATDRPHLSGWCQVSRRMLAATVYPSEAAACRMQLRHSRGGHGGKGELDLAQLGSGTEGFMPTCQRVATTSRPPTPNTVLAA